MPCEVPFKFIGWLPGMGNGTRLEKHALDWIPAGDFALISLNTLCRFLGLFVPYLFPYLSTYTITCLSVLPFFLLFPSELLQKAQQQTHQQEQFNGQDLMAAVSQITSCCIIELLY